nr:sigma factor-like helix-turn-helix DNA-binding protein [Natronocella acetinitrilica]
MRQLLEKLNQREIDVLRQRYGFDGVEPSTLEEVAFRHDVTRERVRQLQKKAIEKIGSRKNLRKLRALIEDEDVIGKIFSNRKLVPWSRVKDLLPELSTEEKLAIDVVYGSLREFLEEEALSNEMGWSIDEGEVDYGAEIEELNQSLRSRILNLLNRMALPIHLSYLDQRIPDYSKQAIREEMEDKFAATFNQGVLAKAPKLPAMTRFTLVLRQAGRGLHCEEIRAKNYELFGRDDSIHAIGGALGRSRDALIVGRGTYDLYENIALDEDRMKEIRERAYAFLREKEQYISTKVIFAEIFQGESSRFGRDFSHFMLLGLLQDDDRFDVRRGMMIGLKKFTPEQGFIRLQDEIVKIVEEAHGPVTVRDIMEELEGRREIFHSTVSGFLDSLACIVRVSRGRYDLTSIVIGDHEQQRAVVTASQIALAGGGKTTFALSEALESVGYFLTPTVLKSFLSKQGGFELHPGDMVKIRRLPDEVRAYDAAIRECIAAEPGVLDSRERLRQRVTERGAKDLTRYDPRPRFGVGEYGPDSDGEAVLNKILSNFGL